MRRRTISVLIFLLKLFTILCSIYSLLLLCRWITPPLGHRKVYFGELDGENNKIDGKNKGGGERTEEEERIWNGRRMEVATKMMKNEEEKGRQMGGGGGRKEQHWLSIGIVASPRQNGELWQVVGHLIGFWAPTPLPSLAICNTAGGKNVPFPAIDEIRNATKGAIPILSINDDDDGDGERTWLPQRMDGRIGKESADYWNCLAKLAQIAPEANYYLLLEDDALPIPEFSRALSSLAAQLDRRPQIDYVKLYHPWAWRFTPWTFQSAALSLIFGLFAHNLPAQFPLDNLATAILVATGTHLIVRKQFYQLFSELRFFLTAGPQLTFAESCCTPAVLFRASSAQKMAKTFGQIVARKGHAKDHILDESGFVGRQTDFNLVVHIGWCSVLRNKVVPTGEIFI